ncbi:MAG: DUF805 domain-containing protein [Proteobacteria bacterium]|nr:DUF805 domain-containing protein [Pseudomonadota bacterium]
MRGEVLRYDDGAGAGLISGDDGVRYNFRRADLQQLKPIRAGARVDFVAQDGAALEIFLLDSQSAQGELESSGEDLSLWGYFWKCIRKSFSGDGRARRKEYWGFTLFVWIFLILGFVVVAIINSATGGGYYTSSYGSSDFTLAANLAAGALGLLFLAIIPASITVAIRRLHDIGMTGWWILALLVPYIGGLFLFVCSLIDSERRVNKHGLFPKPL